MSEAVLGNIFYINLDKRLLNVAILIVLYKLLHLIFRRKPVGFAISSFGVVIYAIVSTFVVRFRNRPIEPWDFSALSTAMDVASNYDISINYMMITALFVCFVLYMIMRRCPRHVTKINKYYTVYPILVLILAIFFNSIGSYYLWDIRLLNTFQTEGTLLSFTGLVRQFINDQPKEPEGYSKDALEDIRNEMTLLNEADVKDENAVVPTNIIMVMNESFSDLSVGGTEYAANMTPYFDSLENTIRGNLYVSVRGGGTCNSEYETLTGNTTAFFSAGVYPYNQYMNRDVPSLVSYMNEYGYVNFAGGSNFARYAPHQIPFIGINYANPFRSSIMVAGMEGRERVAGNNYVSLIANILRTGDKFPYLFGSKGTGYWGFAVKYLYNTRFGPLSLDIHWSDYNHRVGAYLNLGYFF